MRKRNVIRVLTWTCETDNGSADASNASIIKQTLHDCISMNQDSETGRGIRIISSTAREMIGRHIAFAVRTRRIGLEKDAKARTRTLWNGSPQRSLSISPNQDDADATAKAMSTTSYTPISTNQIRIVYERAYHSSQTAFKLTHSRPLPSRSPRGSERRP